MAPNLGMPTPKPSFMYILSNSGKNIARKQDCGRIEWSVLNWNTPSIEFYKNSLGAAPMDEWTVYRLTEF